VHVESRAFPPDSLQLHVPIFECSRILLAAVAAGTALEQTSALGIPSTEGILWSVISEELRYYAE